MPGRVTARWSRALLALPLVCVAGTAAAQPARIPDGYTFAQHGAMGWTYPTRAESEIDGLREHAEEAWREVSRALGGSIDPTLDIRVGVDPTAMRTLAGRPLPGYASGVAFPAEGLVLLTMTDPASFRRPDLQRVLVHEMAHVALYRAAGGRPVPRWLSEGVAIHLAGERSIARIRELWEGAVQRRLIPLADLSSAFPARHDEVSLAYAQSADIVAHLLDAPADRPRFRTLVADLATGEAFQEALKSAYGITPGQLEREWRSSLDGRFGRWPTVLMGLTVIWVLGALLLVLGYVRIRRRHRRTLEQWALEEAPAMAVAPPPPPTTVPKRGAIVPTHGGPDAVLDALAERSGRDSDIPTVVHGGQSYTLH